jgi:hypothetical protein
MQKETGYCDRCGADARHELWLTYEGDELCRDCASSQLLSAVNVERHASRPEARDDGR